MIYKHLSINTKTRDLFCDDDCRTIGVCGENDVEVIVFKFDEFVDGVPAVEVQIEDNKYLITEVVKNGETYELIVKNSLLSSENLLLNLRISIEGNVVFKTKPIKLLVSKCVEATENIPEEYETWFESANEKLVKIDERIEEVENLDLDGIKVNDVATITITKKDGTTKTIDVLDGVGINNIEEIPSQDNGGINRIIITMTNGTSYELTTKNGDKGDKGDKGDAGSIQMIIVNQLPEEGENGIIYLIPNTDPGNQNNYDEYIYTDIGWEMLGGASVQVDLTDYVKFTDYATANVAGVVRVLSATGVGITNGILTISRASNNDLEVRTDVYKPVVSANLDYAVKQSLAYNKLTDDNVWTDEQKTNARTLLNAVGKEDYASGSKHGLVKTNSAYGISMRTGGIITTLSATEELINEKTNAYRPIVPANLDYAVKTSVTTNTIALSDEEKTNAQNWLGVSDLIGDINTVLATLTEVSE